MKIILSLGDRKSVTVLGLGIFVLAPILIPDLLTESQHQTLIEHLLRFFGVLLTVIGKSLLKD